MSGWFRAKSSRWPCRAHRRFRASCSRRRCSRCRPRPAARRRLREPARRTEQPKRIRTVPIRPEGGDTSGRPSERCSRAGCTAERTDGAVCRAAADADRSTRPAAVARSCRAGAGTDAARPQQRPLTPPAPRETAAPAPGSRPCRRPARRPTRTATAMAVAIWCRCRRSEASRTRRRHIARCRRNIRSSSRGSRSSGVPISAPKACSIAPWWPVRIRR